MKVDGNGWVVFGDPTWSHYNLTFQVRATEGCPNFKVEFHFRDTDKLRELFASPDGWKFGSIVNRRWEHESLSKARFVLDVWYDVRLEVRGPTCRCLVGDQQLLDSFDDSIKSGLIGFAADGSVAFREIKVTSEDDKTILWRGNPKLPPYGVIPTIPGSAPNDKPQSTVDLLPLIDATNDAVEGRWTRERGRIDLRHDIAQSDPDSLQAPRGVRL